MVTAQLVTAIVVFIFKSSAGTERFQLVNCTEYKNCNPPFEVCDSLTGACQVVERYKTSTDYPNFWKRSKIDPSSDRLTAVVCNEDGLYPSHDCRYFHQCSNGTSRLRSCDSPGFPYFDPVSERCVSSSTCPSFQCVERFDVRVGLEGKLSSFFAYCFAPTLFYYNGGIPFSSAYKNVFIPYIVTRCYGKDIYNANTGRCEPRCLEEGSLPDTTDCHHHFLCSLEDPVNSVFTMARFSCPQGQAFLQREHRCVPKERVSACTIRRAWPV